MATEDIAVAVRRVRAVLQRRPETGLHDDAPATVRWEGGTRMVSSHANGSRMVSDMPAEFGGSGDQVSPGWLFRAGLASCASTCIVLRAAEAGIELAALEVKASSRSDARGLLGMAEADGRPVGAGPQAMQLQVRIAAHGVPAERLRAVVEEAVRCSPIACALPPPTPFGLQVEIVGT